MLWIPLDIQYRYPVDGLHGKAAQAEFGLNFSCSNYEIRFMWKQYDTLIIISI